MDKDAIKEGFRQRRETLQGKGFIAQLIITILGVILTLAGIAMLVLPGPAFVVLPLGLAMLSVRFAWAARLLDVSINATAAASQSSRRTKLIAASIATAAVAAALFGYFLLKA